MKKFYPWRIRIKQRAQKFTCWWSGHPAWDRVRKDTNRGIVCGLSYFEECTRCGETRGVMTCYHTTCTHTLLLCEHRGMKVVRKDIKDWKP